MPFGVDWPRRPNGLPYVYVLRYRPFQALSLLFNNPSACKSKPIDDRRLLRGRIRTLSEYWK
jgi:hypothetical protein